MRKAIIFFSFSLCLSGCSWSNFPLLYKPNIQQGNILANDRVAALQLGMNQDEVSYLLGNPLLENTFANQTTVYVYTFKKGKGTMHEELILLTFTHDHLTAIQHNTNKS